MKGESRRRKGRGITFSAARCLLSPGATPSDETGFHAQLHNQPRLKIVVSPFAGATRRDETGRDETLREDERRWKDQTPLRFTAAKLGRMRRTDARSRVEELARGVERAGDKREEARERRGPERWRRSSSKDSAGKYDTDIKEGHGRREKA